MRWPRRFRSRKSSIVRDITIAMPAAPLTARVAVPPPTRGLFLSVRAGGDLAGSPSAVAKRNRAMRRADAAVGFPIHLKRARRDREDRDRSGASDFARAAAAAQGLVLFAGARREAPQNPRRSRSPEPRSEIFSRPQ